MQKVATFLLEHHDGMDNAQRRADAESQIKNEIEQWLNDKGVTNLSNSGRFQPENGSDGTFSIEGLSDRDRNLWMLKLDETTSDGCCFTTTISIINGTKKISVYVTLETGWTSSHVKPVDIDPRCPRIVRTLLGNGMKWYHRNSLLNPMQEVHGFEAGKTLCQEITNPYRSVPIIVISTINGQPVVPYLDTNIEYDLTGLANIYVLDDAASWALSDILGHRWFCYWGAVRLYWPQFATDQDRYCHPLWTAAKIQFLGTTENESRNKMREILRRRIFRAAALSVVQPLEIDEIQDSANRATLMNLKERANSLEEFQELADSYAKDNDQLRAEIKSLRKEREELATTVIKLEGNISSLKCHLEATKNKNNTSGQTDDDNCEAGNAPDYSEPVTGEIRHYKKVYATPSHDVLVPFKDCGHNNWKHSAKAEKARKGIARLENRPEAWKDLKLEHCSQCTGGGVWRVTW